MRTMCLYDELETTRKNALRNSRAQGQVNIPDAVISGVFLGGFLNKIQCMAAEIRHFRLSFINNSKFWTCVNIMTKLRHFFV
jgi:hypothetical protein